MTLTLMLGYAVIKLFNWIKLVTQLSAANHSYLFQGSKATYAMTSNPDDTLCCNKSLQLD